MRLGRHNGFVFVAYTNGADSTGLSGSSTVVQYDSSGNVVFTYTLAGYVDGLKFNPITGQFWALQNQDGNSTLSLIDPVAHTVSAPLSPAVPSGTRGFDDLVPDGTILHPAQGDQAAYSAFASAWRVGAASSLFGDGQGSATTLGYSGRSAASA
jgi:hypothetical protein